MSQVLTEICEWVRKLAHWEQVAFNHVLEGTAGETGVIDALVDELLSDAGLGTKRPAEPLKYLEEPPEDGAGASHPPKLVRLSNLKNVNALAPGQSLWFGPTLTTVFGGNGSGKSGYARVLGSAAFSRGDTTVLPNVRKKHDGALEQTVDIDIGNGSVKTITHKIGRPNPELRSFYVFDTYSVASHLTASHKLSFSPAGLRYLSALASLTDQVRAGLQSRIDAARRPHAFRALFTGKSAITEVIDALSGKTDLVSLEKQVTLTEADREKQKALDLEIAQLKSLNVPDKVRDLTKQVETLEKVKEQISALDRALNADALKGLRAATETHRNAARIAAERGVAQFTAKGFKGVGTEEWQAFIDAAHALSIKEGTASSPYPADDAHCLLCQQKLSTTAVDLLRRLWLFLEEDAKEKERAAAAALEKHTKALQGIDVKWFGDNTTAHAIVTGRLESGVTVLKTFLADAVARRDAMLNEVKGSEASVPQLSSVKALTLVTGLTTALVAEREALKAEDHTAKLAELQRQHLHLQHRVILAEQFPAIRKYVSDWQWAEKATKVGGSTLSITKKHNELFARLVSDEYVRRFEATLVQLRCPLSVRVETKGKKGDTLKQLVIRVDDRAPDDLIGPDKVLSEGEKRAIALADFLTEVGMDTRGGGIILDDPVTSLDVEWKSAVVPTLVAEAKRRQVIVFTHDLHFLWMLHRGADAAQVKFDTHWITRGTDDVPGYVHRDNSPSMEKDYKTTAKAREWHAKAKAATGPQEQEAYLRDGFGALRTTYEAFVIFEVFCGVVQRWDEQISIGVLKGVVVDPQISKEVIANIGRLSRFIEAHLHSDGQEKPTVKTLVDEIELFEELKKRQIALKKAIA